MALTAPSPAVARTSESALVRRGTRDIASSTDARHSRTALVTSSGVSVTTSREPVVSVTTVSGWASTVRMRSGFRWKGWGSLPSLCRRIIAAL